MNAKKILLTNDDGVNSSGLLASKNAVKDLGDFIISAPSTQQSAIGRALTLFSPLRINKTFLKDRTPAYSVSGTPADSVILGIFEIMKKDVDLVIAGINIGHNTGKSGLTTSGTISAAMEAASHDIPAIAVSRRVNNDSIKFDGTEPYIDFSAATAVTNKLSKKILKHGLPDNVDLINVNIPENPVSNEIVISELSNHMYYARISKRTDPRGKSYYWIDGEKCEDYPVGSDLYTIEVLKQPSLTPLSLDCTIKLDDVTEWLSK